MSSKGIEIAGWLVTSKREGVSDWGTAAQLAIFYA